MPYVNRTIIVPELHILTVRALVVAVAGASQAGFCPRKVLKGLAVYWMGSGPIEADKAPMLDSAGSMSAACTNAGQAMTTLQCQAILGACMVTARTDVAAYMAENGFTYPLEIPA